MSRDRSRLDLGKDHEAAAPAAEAQAAARRRLLSATRGLVAESVELGLSHLSPGIQQRYSTLAVWAQGVGYQRLALLLRRVADHVDLLLGRTGGADEHRLLDELATVFGLVTALEHADARGAAPAHLVGQARSRYDDAGTLELAGLGALAWRSGSGYEGLTMVFWSRSDSSFFTCTDARPESMWGWNPIQRYKSPGPWTGLDSPEEATGRLLTLSGASVNAGGRLSAAAGTNAAVRPVPPNVRLADLLRPYRSWAELARDRSRQRRSLLAEAQPVKDWVALQPVSLGPASFDSARQTLVVPATDEPGERLDVVLGYSDVTQHAIGRLEQVAAQPLEKGTLLVARVRRSRGRLVAEPLSLVAPHAGDRTVDALHFDAAPKKLVLPKVLARRRGTPGSAPPVVEEPAPVLPAALRELRWWLQSQAERGLSEDVDAQAAGELAGRLERTVAAGLTAVPAPGGGRASERLLAAHYLCMQYERLVDDSPELVG